MEVRSPWAVAEASVSLNGSSKAVAHLGGGTAGCPLCTWMLLLTMFFCVRSVNWPGSSLLRNPDVCKLLWWLLMESRQIPVVEESWSKTWNSFPLNLGGFDCYSTSIFSMMEVICYM